MNRHLFATLALALFVAVPDAAGAEEVAATLYKTPGCGCCDGHAAHLRSHGYEITVIETDELAEIKQRHRVPAALAGCHTLLVDGYVVEGHVPAGLVDRLLDERPAISGIALPGMPQGSPGMSGSKTAPFVIYGFTATDTEVYAVE